MRKLAAVLLVLTPVVLFAEEPVSSPAPEQPVAPSPEIMIKQVDSLCVVVLPMKGSYAQHEEAIARLMSYLPDTLKVAPLGPPFGRYFNNPMEAAEADLLWEVGMEVASGVAPTPPFESKVFPTGEVAYTIFTGPYENAGNAWPGVYMWVMSRGYTPAGPPMEIWLGGDGPQTELRLPVTAPAPTGSTP
ncbi:MAG: GyrI-like domain-containing protein [Candidatus Eisenbacteria bacterium]|jgi:effector-binding domain-containing protein|nr:GyrI-like domain-containing protein [Candidatus Eisenbacteria bacterium]